MVSWTLWPPRQLKTVQYETAYEKYTLLESYILFYISLAAGRGGQKVEVEYVQTLLQSLKMLATLLLIFYYILKPNPLN